MTKPIIYLDMDGVLVDFEAKALELAGSDWAVELDKPGWGLLANYPNLYEIMGPMSDAVMLYEGCVEVAGDRSQVQILTALSHRASAQFPDAAKHKVAWARKYIHPNIRVQFGPLAVHKQLHVTHKHDVLIDDMVLNIEQWNAAGGNGILHNDAVASLDRLHRTWNKEPCNHNNSVFVSDSDNEDGFYRAVCVDCGRVSRYNPPLRYFR